MATAGPVVRVAAVSRLRVRRRRRPARLRHPSRQLRPPRRQRLRPPARRARPPHRQHRQRASPARRRPVSGPVLGPLPRHPARQHRPRPGRNGPRRPPRHPSRRRLHLPCRSRLPRSRRPLVSSSSRGRLLPRRQLVAPVVPPCRLVGRLPSQVRARRGPATTRSVSAAAQPRLRQHPVGLGPAATGPSGRAATDRHPARAVTVRHLVVAAVTGPAPATCRLGPTPA
jgi:hypothetical protein